jgi:hypothetical protein
MRGWQGQTVTRASAGKAALSVKGHRQPQRLNFEEWLAALWR